MYTYTHGNRQIVQTLLIFHQEEKKPLLWTGQTSFCYFPTTKILSFLLGWIFCFCSCCPVQHSKQFSGFLVFKRNIFSLLTFCVLTKVKELEFMMSVIFYPGVKLWPRRALSSCVNLKYISQHPVRKLTVRVWMSSRLMFSTGLSASIARTFPEKWTWLKTQRLNKQGPCWFYCCTFMTFSYARTQDAIQFTIS